MSESNSSSSDSSSKKFKKKRKGLPTPVCLLALHQNWTQQTLTMLRTVITVIQKQVTMEQLAVVSTMGIIHNFAIELQVFIIIGAACPLLMLNVWQVSKSPFGITATTTIQWDIYSPDQEQYHVQGHPQLHMQAQPQRHVQMHLQCQIPSHLQVDIQVHPQHHIQAQPKHHIKRYPEHDIMEKNVHQ